MRTNALMACSLFPVLALLPCGVAHAQATRSPADNESPGAHSDAAPPPSSLPSTQPEDRRARAFIFMQTELAPGGGYSDASGGVDITRARATLDLLLPVSDEGAVGVAFLTEYGVYDFDPGTGAAALGKPWGDVTGNRIGLSYSHAIDDHWSAFVGGGVESLREVGANFGSSLHYSGATGAKYQVSKDLSIGLAAAFQTSLEDTPTYFPFPLVEWKIDEHWKLTSGISRAPGVGIEYGTLDRQWAIALRTRYESREFRLADTNLVSPGGVGIDRKLPVYFDIDWNLSEQFSLNAMFGVSFLERLAYQDGGGATLARTDMDPAPFFSFGIALRF